MSIMVVDQQVVHYEVFGYGRPVLFLHGWMGSWRYWYPTIERVAEHFRTYSFDFWGFGDTRQVKSRHESIQSYSDQVIRFLDELGIDRVLLVGHSMGGMVALLLAKLHPELLRALVIVDVAPELSERGTAVIRDFVQRNVEFDDPDEFLDRVARYDPFRKREHMARTLKYNLLRRADGKYVSKHDRRRVENPFGDERVTLECVERFDFPTLVVRGAESAVLEPEAAERFAARLPEGRLVTIPACGHNVHSQNTPGFLAAVAPFLASVTG